MRTTTLVTCLIATLSAPSPGQAQTAQQVSADIPHVVASARGTVVLIKSFDRQGKILGLGSGFRIAGGRFVTNAHVVAGAGRVEIFDDSGALLGIARYAEMLSMTVDLAILPAVGIRTPTLSLASVPPPVGEQIIVIGAPEGLTNTVSDGIVSAVRKLESRQLLQITAPISPGSSGGPVLNRRGEVVGVSVSILREGQNLNFAVPVADVIALVASHPGQFQFPSAADEGEDGSSSSERSGRKTKGTLPLLTVGSDERSAITTADRLSNGAYVSYHRLTGVDGTSAYIWVGSDDFDAAVGVYKFVGDSVVVVTFDDDSGGGLNAKATVTFSGNVTYYVGVFAADRSGSKIGNYIIRVVSTPTHEQAAAAPAADEEARWLWVGRTDKSFVEFDRTSIASSGYLTYLVWERSTYAKPYKDSDGETADSYMLQYELSCSDRRYRLRVATKYLKGALVSSSNWLGEWDTTVPESIGETVTKTVCAYAKAHGI